MDILLSRPHSRYLYDDGVFRFSIYLLLKLNIWRPHEWSQSPEQGSPVSLEWVSKIPEMTRRPMAALH